MLDKYGYLVYVLPLMASLIKKKKGNRLYYYLVESARVDGQTSHRSSGLSHHRRKSRRTHRSKVRPGSPLRHLARLRSPPRLHAACQTVRITATSRIPVASSAFPTPSRSLSPARGYSPHL